MKLRKDSAKTYGINISTESLLKHEMQKPLIVYCRREWDPLRTFQTTITNAIPYSGHAWGFKWNGKLPEQTKKFLLFFDPVILIFILEKGSGVSSTAFPDSFPDA